MRWVKPKPDRRNVAARERILERLRGEFREMPRLRLTSAQAQRLLGLRPDVCDRVLHALVAEGTLCPDGTGRYAPCAPPQAVAASRAQHA
jgi:hypothetical protein